jgi:hypothetical protein
MPTPRQIIEVARQLRVSAASAPATADWLAGVVVTADGNTAEGYTVQLSGTGGVVDATSSIDAPLAVGSSVWVTVVGGKHVVVGVQ